MQVRLKNLEKVYSEYFGFSFMTQLPSCFLIGDYCICGYFSFLALHREQFVAVVGFNLDIFVYPEFFPSPIGFEVL